MATSTLGNGTLVLAGTTSGTTTVTATAVAGTTTLTLPAATDTLVGKTTTDTLTNKTLTTPSVSSPTISDGTANGVAFLNGSKVLTTGSALVFDGTNFSTTGTIKGATTFGVGNATPSTSGAGITFPSTESASSDANTLDDYEEGTWTPTITKSGVNPTVTYTNQSGTYVKVGRSVSVTCGINWSANSGGTGNFVLSGLPFANSSAAGNYSQAFCVDISGITFAVGTTTLGGYVNVNDTRVFLTCAGSAVSSSAPTLGGSGYIYMSVTYVASA